MFVRNDSFAQYDEQFFLYYEETDLQFKMLKNGFRSKIINIPKIIHLEGCSCKKESNKFKTFSGIQACFSRIKYMRKNVSALSCIIIKLLVIIFFATPVNFRTNIKYIGKIIKI